MTDSAPPNRAPETAWRHPLIRWCFDKGVDLKQAAADLSITYNGLRRYCLPYSDPGRQRPRDDVLARIVAYTGGAVTAEDFFPDHLTRAARIASEVRQ